MLTAFDWATAVWRPGCAQDQQVGLKGHSYGEVSRVIVLIEALLFGGLAAQGQQVGHLIRESGTFVDCIRLGRWSLETWLHSDDKN